MLKNVNKIDEFAAHSSNLNLRYVEILRGFDPDIFFYNIYKHLASTIVFSKNTYLKTETPVAMHLLLMPTT